MFVKSRVCSSLLSRSSWLRHIVHLFVEEGSIRAHVRLSFALHGRWLLMMIRVIVLTVCIWISMSVKIFCSIVETVARTIRVGTIWVWRWERHTEIGVVITMFAAHVAVVLLSTNVEVLISFLGYFAFIACMSRGWFSHDRLNFSGLKAMNSVNIFGTVGLHLQY